MAPALAVIILLICAGCVAVISGVVMLAGPGWGLLAFGVCAFANAALLMRGL